jgi:predicted DNA-binding transcriptional regulator AlpA
MTIERLLSTEEAAEVLGMNRSWLDRARVAGEGPSFVRLGRVVKYRPDDLRSFIEQNCTAIQN